MANKLDILARDNEILKLKLELQLTKTNLAISEKAIEVSYHQQKENSTPADWIYHISKDEYIQHIKTEAKRRLTND